MANSKFEYVRKFENCTKFIPQTWIIVRVDGRNFHRFTTKHCFEKPNDKKGIDLLALAAQDTMDEFGDIILSYGYSDEFSFLLGCNTTLYNRRAEKISTTICSYFTASYIFNWKSVFKDLVLLFPPSFDARAFFVPHFLNVKDYFSWRQADCHINNLYNTAFWTVLKSPSNQLSPAEVHQLLKTTNSAGKNELLFSDYGINYNNELEVFRKGTVIHRGGGVSKKVNIDTSILNQDSKFVVGRMKYYKGFIDIISDDFWNEFFIPCHLNTNINTKE